MIPTVRLAGWFLLSLTALGLSACGGGARNPVTGKVTSKGEPCKGAMVIFHPVDQNGPNVIRPSGVVADDGTFYLTSDPRSPGDGAAPGDYVVTIIWNAPPAATKGKLTMDGESKGGETDRFDGKYRDHKTSPLRATVKPGKNQLDPFDLR